VCARVRRVRVRVHVRVCVVMCVLQANPASLFSTVLQVCLDVVVFC